METYMLYNTVRLICFAALAIVFKRWWIVFFAILFWVIPTK